jgi:23S rRNA-/tRNA-specific pseudouridylate synthase
MIHHHRIRLEQTYAAERLDIALAQQSWGYSKGQIRRIIENGGAYVNKKRVRVASRQVKPGDEIELYFDPDEKDLKSLAHAALTAEMILYHDRGIIALNKPPGMPSQATRTQAVYHVGECLKFYFRHRGEPADDFILVHRLDKETSGVTLLAKNSETATYLTHEFREHRIVKTYHAWVRGLFPDESREVNLPLSAPDRLMERFDAAGLSLVECAPLTGRTHQIRVHLEALGYPLLGDKKYGAAGSFTGEHAGEIARLAQEHHFLHARTLRFRPDKGLPALTVTADYSPLFGALWDVLRG